MCVCILRQTSVHLHAIAQTPSRRWHRVDSVMNVAWVLGREKDGTREDALLDVVERVLRDVADARVRVLPDRARRRLHFSG